jgi:hypothetical protein
MRLIERERDKLKNKLKKKSGELVCKICGRQYTEIHNMNWSCNTHSGLWGGEMWWCCGKKQREAKGCKFSKHTIQSDDLIENDEGL